MPMIWRPCTDLPEQGWADVSVMGEAGAGPRAEPTCTSTADTAWLWARGHPGFTLPRTSSHPASLGIGPVHLLRDILLALVLPSGITPCPFPLVTLSPPSKADKIASCSGRRSKTQAGWVEKDQPWRRDPHS